MSHAVHYWIEYKNKDDKWSLFNPKNIDKEGKEKHYNSDYFQGWLKDQIFYPIEYNHCEFVNRGYPKDVSEELKIILDNTPEEHKKWRYYPSYVTLKELSDYLEKEKEHVEKQIKTLIEQDRLDVINENLITLAKIIEGKATSKAIKIYSNEPDDNDEYSITEEYKEDLESIDFWQGFVENIAFMLSFMTDGYFYDEYSKIRLVYYCN